jgi:hypothetical protein
MKEEVVMKLSRPEMTHSHCMYVESMMRGKTQDHDTTRFHRATDRNL